MLSKWILLLILFFVNAVHAAPLACNLTDNPSQYLAKAQASSCEIHRAACEEKFKDNPDLKQYLKNCNGRDEARAVSDHILQCLELFPKPLFDAAKDVVVSLAKKAKSSVAETKAQIDLCQKSASYRKFMISQVPVLKGFEKKPATFVACAAIVTEYENWAVQQPGYEVLDKLTSPELQKLLEAKNHNKGSPESQDVFRRIWNQQQEKFSCLNNYGQTYLSCYYAFSVVDPTLLAGLALKVPKLVKFFDLPVPFSKMRPIASLDEVVETLPTVDTGLVKVEKAIGKKPYVVVDGSDLKKDIKILDAGGNEMGTLDVYFDSNRKQLEVGVMETNPEYHGKGIGEALMEQALKAFPDAEIIETSCLIQTNRDALKKAMKRGLTIEEAIKETPAYKIRSRFGFTEIVPGSIDNLYGFKVRRPALAH